MSRPDRPVKLHIKTGDMVVAIAGEAAAGGRAGKVLRVFPREGRAVVEGFNYVKKALRKSQDNPQGGIIEKEAPIHVSNLRLADAAETGAAEKKVREKAADKSAGGHRKKETE